MEILGPKLDRLILFILWIATIAASGALCAFLLKRLWTGVMSLIPSAKAMTFNQAFSIIMIELLVLCFAMVFIDSYRIVFKRDHAKESWGKCDTQPGPSPYAKPEAAK